MNTDDPQKVAEAGHASLIAELRDAEARTRYMPHASEASRTLLSRVISALAATPASPQAPAPQAVVESYIGQIEAGTIYKIGDDVDVWVQSGTSEAHYETGFKVVGWRRGPGNYITVFKEGDLRGAFEVGSPQYRLSRPSPAPSAAPHQGADALRGYAMATEAPEAPQFLTYEESDMRTVNGIDFSSSMHIPDFAKPRRVVHIFRIGNTKVPRWLYELTLDMAKQIDRSDRSAVSISTIGRAADGTISAEGKHE